MGFEPPITGISTLRLFIANVYGCTMAASSAVCTSSSNPFRAADVGNPVSVLGAGPTGPTSLVGTLPGGAYPNNYMLVSHVASYSSAGSVTLADAASNEVAGDGIDGEINLAIYRPVDYMLESGKCLSVSLSLTSRNTAVFNILSLDGSYVPVRGQPVYITDDTDGDLFGGIIDQVKITNRPGDAYGPAAVESECQCVGWDILLSNRLCQYWSAIYPNATTGGSGSNWTTVTAAVQSLAVTVTGATNAANAVLTVSGSLTGFTVGYGVTLAGEAVSGWNGSYEIIAIGSGTVTISLDSSALGAFTGTAGISTVTVLNVVSATGLAAGMSVSLSVAPTGWNGTFLVESVVGTDVAINLNSFGLAAFSGPAVLTFVTTLDAGDVVTALVWGQASGDGLSTVTVPGPQISEQFNENTTVYDALDRCAEDASTSDASHWWWISAWRVVHFVDDSYAAPWSISESDGSDGNVLALTSIAWTGEKLANRVYCQANQVAILQPARLIFQPLLNGEFNKTPLLGYDLRYATDMPDISVGAGVNAMAFGDFKEGYQIVNRVGISILRDPYTAKPFVLVYTRKRVGGAVKNFDAIKILSLQ